MLSPRNIYLLCFTCASLTILTVMIWAGSLQRTNQKLRQQNHAQAEQLNKYAGITGGPVVGSEIAALHGHAMDKRHVTLDLAHRTGGSLLLVLSPVCPYCRVNFHNWRDLLQTVPSDHVVWVDLSGTADDRYLASVGLAASATVISLDQDESIPSSLVATPTTVLLDSHGVVRWSWSGVMNNDQVDELRGLLLPGVHN